jgi:hypothetical protein
MLGGIAVGSLLIGAVLSADEGVARIARKRIATTEARIAPAAHFSDTGSDTAASTDPSDATSGPACRCPGITGPLTARPVPCGDVYGKCLCHLSFSGDCYGENWRLQNWDGPGCWNRFHRATHKHSLWKERFCNAMLGKRPQGYVYDTTGFPLKSFFVSQPSDPSIAAVPEAISYVYDYPQYVYQPSATGAPCPLTPGDGP